MHLVSRGRLGARGSGTSGAAGWAGVAVVTGVVGRVSWLAWPCFLNICAAGASAAKGLRSAGGLLVGGGGATVEASGVLTLPLPLPLDHGQAMFCSGGGGGGLSSPALGFGTQEESFPASMTPPKVELTTLRGAAFFVAAGLELGPEGAEGEAT